MSFPSSTPSLWDQRPSQDIVHKFATMAVASPRGVEGLATGALSPPPPSHSDQAAERITELARHFFKEIVRKAMTYMEHDRCMSYRTNHLLLALEQFAAEVRQQQLIPEYLEDAIEESGDDKDENGEDEEAEWKEDGDSDDGNEENADEDTMEELVDMEREDYEEEAMEEEQQDGQVKEEGATDAGADANALSTPIYDEIFPPVAAIGFQCLSREILAKTWNDTGSRFYISDLDVTGADRDAFYGKVNDSLNAYIATMLLEPRSLDSAFAKVDD